MAAMGYSAEDELMITREFEELLARCKRICKREGDEELITRAFELAKLAHKGVKRRSGEPYIMHPLAVARICVDEIGLGVKSVVASLLHDVVEDTDYTLTDISTMFSPKIASMVDGLTKISSATSAETSEQIESFRKVLLTLLDDVRVILIKIADRLHNMRTLSSMPPEKRIRISSETLYLFAPLAYRLGLYLVKTELEDLSFRYMHPDQYAEIESKIATTSGQRKEFIDRFNAPIIEKLRAVGIDFEISGRVKSTYSIWNKMRQKQIPFEEVYDVFAVRIVFRPTPIVPEKTQCWHIYELVTDIYASNPDRLRDWINNPKTNGYEALHTTVMVPAEEGEGTWVEVQIRSERMNDIAEHGLASHWKHKYTPESVAVSSSDINFDVWLKNIREALSSPTDNAVDFLDNFQRSLYTSEIVVFTPKGEIRKLPTGSTVLDFAYDIHSKVGAKAIGAKVNHTMASIYDELHNGDQVDVLTSDGVNPTKEWLDHVITAKAKQSIKNFIKRYRQNNIERGMTLFETRMNELGIKPSARVFRKILPAYGSRNKDEFYSKLGADLISLDNIQEILRQNSAKKLLKFWTFFVKGKDDEEEQDLPFDDFNAKEGADDSKSQFDIAECCTPIPGDTVTGYKDPETGRIIVHKTNCPELTKLAAQHGKNLVGNIHWSSYKEMSYLSIIELQGIDRIGMLLDLSQVITGQLNINIRELKMQSHDGIFEGYISLYVTCVEDLNNVMEKIKQIKGIERVTRRENETTENNG